MAIAVVFIVGFFVGLLCFKIKRRWCPDCGSMTTAEVPDRGRRINRV